MCCQQPADERSRELARLLAQVAQGDRAAFAALYRQTSPQLMGVVLRIQRDRAQAEDVLQEVYGNVWRGAQRFDARVSQPLTWLACIARNRAIDTRRRREPATVSASGADGEDLLAQFACDDAGPIDRAQQAGEARSLRHCMAGLSGPQQQCMALAYYQGLTHAEVAAHLGLPLGTVKSWVRRGLASLRNCLGCATATPTIDYSAMGHAPTSAVRTHS